jgi:molybdopterin-biosynthesis enzyme MoeA-like protein
MTEPRSTGAPTIGVLIIGDEILSGRRTDQHLATVIAKLAPRGRLPGWVQIIGDDVPRIERVLRESRARGDIVFCFGGIGATPDDLTRAAAAEAFDRPLQRHPEAVQLIETEFGALAHPNRILMADLPYGAGLIPNPVNRVPGFYLDQHYFMPGFPTMAHPMLDWILTGPLAALDQHDYREQSLWVLDVPESTLIGLMNELCQNYPDLKLFSLPTRLGVRPVIELGFKGAALRVAEVMSLLSVRLDALGIRHQLGRPDAES